MKHLAHTRTIAVAFVLVAATLSGASAQGTQTIDFASPAGSVTGAIGGRIALRAETSAPGLFVSFTISPPTGIATLTDNGDGTGTLVLDAIGEVVVTASQTGDASYTAATSVMRTITVEAAQIFYVDESVAGLEDGSDFANAITLQGALAVAVAGDQIWIAAGTYTPHLDDRATTFSIPAGVLVYGGFDPVADASDTDASSRSGAATILSGDLAGDDDATNAATRDENSNTVVTITGANVMLDGLTITAGKDGTEYTNPSDGNVFRLGAGLYEQANATGTVINNCMFTENSVSSGRSGFGGGACFLGEVTTLTGCTFTGNGASVGGGGAYFAVEATLTGCTFTGNRTSESGGGAYFTVEATLTDCTFTGNQTSVGGGGAYFAVEATLTNCTFTDNRASANSGNSTLGGGAYFVKEATLTNCTFTDNQVSESSGSNAFGGGAYFVEEATLTGCAFTSNQTSASGGITDISVGGGAYFAAEATLTNCSFTDNDALDLDRARDGGFGGGAYFLGVSTVISSTFTGNEAVGFGGGAYFVEATITSSTFTNNEARIGGGAHFRGVSTVTSSTFTGNEARFGGGASFIKNGALTNCIFADNRVMGSGGGLRLLSGGSVINTTFYNNRVTFLPLPPPIGPSDGIGGAIAVAYEDSDPDTDGIQTNPLIFRNNILIGNIANGGGSQAYVHNANDTDEVNIQNNLIAGGATGATAGISYTTPGASGITEANTMDEDDAAVVFASTMASEANYLRLSVDSPAVGAGDNNHIPAGITTDAVGEMRIRGGTVDLGAYESPYITPTYQTITFTSPTSGQTNSMITLAVTTTSMGTVTYAITEVRDADGNVVTGDDADAVATLAGTTLTLVAPGTVTVTASQGGGNIDGVIYAAGTQTQTITVTDVPPATHQTIMFTSPAEGLAGSTITLAATATSTGTVTFAVTEVQDADGNVVTNAAADAVATLASSTLTLVAAGTVTVTASQAGGDINGTTYVAATETQTITIIVPPVVLGIEEATDNFVLYPNPTSGKLHFSEQVAEFHLYGIEGRLLETRKNVRSADLSARPAGLYFVEVVRDGRSVRYRILRE